MAGNYMDAPSDRIPWDRDGSLLLTIDQGGAVTNRSQTERRTLNNEDASYIQIGSTIKTVAIVFPVPMDCAAVFFSASGSTTTWTVETSKDTTNGVDGTWDEQFLTGLVASVDVKPNYRESANLWTLQTNSTSSDLRGIRVRRETTSTLNVRAFHVYGTPAATATDDRLALWHPTLETKIPPTWFDWGNVPRGSSADRSFRIKNLSSTLRATDIDLYVEALTPGSPSVAAMHTFSDNGGATFLPGLTLTALEPGEVSDVIIVRRVVPSDAQVSVWSARIAADVNEWQEVTP